MQIKSKNDSIYPNAIGTKQLRDMTEEIESSPFFPANIEVLDRNASKCSSNFWKPCCFHPGLPQSSVVLPILLHSL